MTVFRIHYLTVRDYWNGRKNCRTKLVKAENSTQAEFKFLDENSTLEIYSLDVKRVKSDAYKVAS